MRIKVHITVKIKNKNIVNYTKHQEIYAYFLLVKILIKPLHKRAFKDLLRGESSTWLEYKKPKTYYVESYIYK